MEGACIGTRFEVELRLLPMALGYHLIAATGCVVFMKATELVTQDGMHLCSKTSCFEHCI